MRDSHPTLPDVAAARDRIGNRIDRTPLVAAAWVDDRVRLKLENRQITGSFKIRGATNAIMSLPQGAAAHGVVAVSSGNHGRAVARAAAVEGITATVCLTSRVPAPKVTAIEELGATVVIAGETQEQADVEARRLAQRHGFHFIHPFDDPSVIAGQGTIGLELIEDEPDLSTVVVPLSGGGLISGIAVALKALKQEIRIVGVSQERGPAMYESMRAGRIVPVLEEDTLADALAGGLGDENHHTLDLCRRLVDETVLVTEEEIAAAMVAAIGNGETVEGGGAVGLAAVLSGKVRPTGMTGVVISGRNVAATVLDRLRRSRWGDSA